MKQKNNYQCKKCGNIHPEHPTRCNCGGTKFRIIYNDDPESPSSFCDYCGNKVNTRRYETLNLCLACADLLGMGLRKEDRK